MASIIPGRSGDEKADRNVAILVDGPNILRKEFNIDLEDVRRIASRFGKIKVAKVFLNQYATEKLIEAVTNQGFLPMIISGDVDVYMAVEGMELINDPTIDVIVISTRDADFMPLIMKAKERGKITVVIGVEQGFSVALRRVADYVYLLKPQE